MKSLRMRRFDSMVAGYCQFMFNRPLIAIVLIIAAFALALSQARNVTRDGSIEGFFHQNAAEIVDYNGFRRQFGQDGQIVIGVSSETLFTAHNLRRLAEFHVALAEEVPYLEDITSLYNTRSVVGGDGLFVVNDLLKHFLRQGDTSAAALNAFKEQVLSHPVYRDLVISADGEMTLITIRPDRFQSRSNTALDNSELDLFAQFEQPNNAAKEAAFLSQGEIVEMVRATHQVAARFEQKDFQIAVAGAPVASTEIVRILSGDMPQFTLICLIVMLLLVIATSRRITAALALFVTIAFTAIATFGLMAATGTAIKPPTQILPSVIIVVSACAVLHLVIALSKARREVDGATQRAAKGAALELAISRVATPIFFTSLTTIAGLLAFAGSPLAPISDLGIFGAAAVAFSLAMVLTITPVLLRVLRFRPGRVSADQEAEPSWAVRQAKKLAVFSARNWAVTLQVTAVVTLLAGLGLFGLRFHHNSLEWLPTDNPVRVDTETIDAKVRGSINLETVIRTDKVYGIQSDTLLAEIDALQSDIQSIGAENGIPVGKVFGVTDLLKEVNKALMPDSEYSYALPKGEMVAREFLLFENSASNDLPDFADSRYTETRVTIRVPWLEAGQYAGFISGVRDAFQTRLSNLGMNDLVVTGQMALLAETSVNVIRSMASSYGLSLLLVGALMLIAMRGVRLGVLAMVPNLVPIAIALGVMGYLGVPLDSFTMLIGCIALGLLVDDTIHFFHHVRVAEADGAGPLEAVERATTHSFMPILSTSIAVAAGFAVYSYSTMTNVTAFGLVVALAAILGLLAEMVLSPALVAAYYALRQRGEPVIVNTAFETPAE